MKKKSLMCVVCACVCALSIVTASGCTGSQTDTQDTTSSTGAPPNLPDTHFDRYEVLGSNGCWGCHGTNDEGEQLLGFATMMPQDHFKDGDTTSSELDPTHNQCITCHSLS